MFPWFVNELATNTFANHINYHYQRLNETVRWLYMHMRLLNAALIRPKGSTIMAYSNYTEVYVQWTWCLFLLILTHKVADLVFQAITSFRYVPTTNYLPENTNFCHEKRTSGRLIFSLAFAALDWDWSYWQWSPVTWINRRLLTILVQPSELRCELAFLFTPGLWLYQHKNCGIRNPFWMINVDMGFAWSFPSAYRLDRKPRIQAWVRGRSKKPSVQWQSSQRTSEHERNANDGDFRPQLISYTFPDSFSGRHKENDREQRWIRKWGRLLSSAIVASITDWSGILAHKSCRLADSLSSTLPKAFDTASQRAD